MRKNSAFAIVVFCVLTVWIALYFAVVHPAFLRWGATAEENARVLPGEAGGGRIPPAASLNTRAITIDAPPEKVWPWLARLGIGRGGFYSYPWLKNLIFAGIHNSEELDPAAPARASGDFVRSFQFGADKPGFNGWRFDVLEDGRAFYLDPGWGPFVLEPIGASQTRLLIRNRGEFANPIVRVLLGLFFDPIHFTMEKRMMVEVKRLAEARPEPLRLLAAPAGLGFFLAAFIASAIILTRKRKKLWILVPLVYALLIVVLAHDAKAALTGFTAAALIVAAFRALGRCGWAFIAGFWIYVDLVLIYAHDAYLIFGLAFLAAAFVFFQIRALRLRQARLVSAGPPRA
jgi:hypothetical protein